MNPEMLQNLLHISRRMAETRTLDPLLVYAMNEVLAFIGAERGYLILSRVDSSLDFRVRCDRAGREIDKPEEEISHTILHEVIDKGVPRVIADAIGTDDLQYAESVLSLQLHSIMCVPLIARGTTLGAIYVENRSQRDLFDEADLEPLELFAAQAAVCIENAILNQNMEGRVAARTAALQQANEQLKREIQERKRVEAKLQELATTDELTQIFNRRHFFKLARREFKRAQRYHHPLSIVLMDLDHFKRVNDRHGHPAGDQALRTVATVCQDNLREIDILARYGGEEFILLLPEIGADPARQAAERLRQKIAAESIAIGGQTIAITASLGVASLEEDGEESVGAVLHRADQALYTAKKAGRNRVKIWQAS